MGRSRKIAPVVLVASAAAGLSACAVSAPLSIDSTGSLRGTSQSIVMSVSTEDATPARAVFGGALIKTFAANSIQGSDKGALLIDFAVSIGDASSGILAGEQQPTEDGAESNWIAEPRKSRRFDKCRPKRLSGSLVVIDRATSAPVYTGHASRVECDFNDRDIEKLAEALANDAAS